MPHRLGAVSVAICLTLLDVASSSPTPSRTQNVKTIPLSKLLSPSFSAKSLNEKGLARLAGYNDPANLRRLKEGLLEHTLKPANAKMPKRMASATVTNYDVTYVASVSVGGESFDLIVDTGSSNTWVRL